MVIIRNMNIYVMIEDGRVVLNAGVISLVYGAGPCITLFAKRKYLSFDSDVFHEKIESNDEDLIKMFYTVNDILRYETPDTLIQEASDKLLLLVSEIIKLKKPELLL